MFINLKSKKRRVWSFSSQRAGKVQRKNHPSDHKYVLIEHCLFGLAVMLIKCHTTGYIFFSNWILRQWLYTCCYVVNWKLNSFKLNSFNAGHPYTLLRHTTSETHSFSQSYTRRRKTIHNSVYFYCRIRQ